MVDSLFVLSFLFYLALKNWKKEIKYGEENEADTLNCSFTEAGSLETVSKDILLDRQKVFLIAVSYDLTINVSTKFS